MDFLSLPNTVHREVLKLVELKDRLRLRLTCRALEKLVAESNAGYFRMTDIWRGKDDSFSIKIGDMEIRITDQSEEGFERVLYFRERLFNKISLARVAFLFFTADNSTVDFIVNFMKKIEFDRIRFTVRNEDELQCAIRLMAAFPTCKVSMQIWDLPKTDSLLSLNRVDDMTIVRGQVPIELFFKLLHNHQKLNLISTLMRITSGEWRRAMKTVSDATCDRDIRMTMIIPQIVDHLLDFGISERSRAGDRWNEFEVCHVKDECLLFRYHHCWIRCERDVWTKNDNIANLTDIQWRDILTQVIMTNYEPSL